MSVPQVNIAKYLDPGGVAGVVPGVPQPLGTSKYPCPRKTRSGPIRDSTFQAERHELQCQCRVSSSSNSIDGRGGAVGRSRWRVAFAVFHSYLVHKERRKVCRLHPRWNIRSPSGEIDLTGAPISSDVRPPPVPRVCFSRQN